MLKQKARLKWEIQGDTNSKFYHQFIKFKNRKNQIHGIWDSDVWISNPEKVKAIFRMHFIKLFSAGSTNYNLSSNSLCPKKLKEEESLFMIAPFTELEIEKAISVLGSSKAPGPDGLNGAFIKMAWPHLKVEYMELAKDFQNNHKLPIGINSSFITLIPKVDSPKSVGEFRSISLINFTMKILLKSLATRLGEAMQVLVSDNQTTFIKGRSISDGIIIANEVADSIQRKECRGLILKIDFAKAFDTVKWDFLFSTLRLMNFKEQWISWLQTIFSSAR